MSQYMAKGPPTKDQPANSGTPGQNIPAQIDPNNAFQQQQQHLLSTIQQQIYMQQAAGQVLTAQGWSSLTQQNTVSTMPQIPQLQQQQNQMQFQHQSQLPVQHNQQQPPQQQQQQPNITISRVSAPPTTTVNQGGSNAAANQSQPIPVTQALPPTTTAPVIPGHNNAGTQPGAAPSTPKSTLSPSTNQSPNSNQAKSVSNNVSPSQVKPPALAPLSQTPPKPQVNSVPTSPVPKPAESPKNTTALASPGAKQQTPVKETTSSILPPRPISHQNTASISIVQKTPTKSTLKLATVTPRIKTTPKKSPTAVGAPPPTSAPAAATQRSPVQSPVSNNNPVPAPAPADRPNAVIKPKESPKTVPAVSPPKQEAPKPTPIATPAKPEVTPETTKTSNSSASAVSNQVVSNNLQVTAPASNSLEKEKDEKETKPANSTSVEKESDSLHKKEPQETPKVPSANVVAPTVDSSSVVTAKSPVVKENQKEVTKAVKAPAQTKTDEKKESAPVKVEPVKKEAKTPAKRPERQQTVAKPVLQTPKQEPKPSTSNETGSTGRTRRARKEVQPFQSPIPEIEVAKKASIIEKATTSKESEKLTIFYKNEFLAVRNADGGFYICQAASNVTRKGQRINIRWYNEQNPGSGIYIPDYFDKTEFECVLTTVDMEKSGRSNYKIPEPELKRVQHILKNALDVEKGIVPKPEITEENPDGLDLSLYTSETQLERPATEQKTPKSNKKGTTGNQKSAGKAGSKRKRDESEEDDDDDEDDSDSDNVVLAKTVKVDNEKQPAKERSQRVAATPVTTGSKKRKAPEPAQAPPAKKAAPITEKPPAKTTKAKSATQAKPVEKAVEVPEQKPEPKKPVKAPETAAAAPATKQSNSKKAPAPKTAPPKAVAPTKPATTTKKGKETPLAANSSTNSGRPTRASRK